MAVDEALLEATACEESPSVLRLYAWDPPCLSLGHAQPIADVCLEALEDRGWDLVRRPTGGRAILHTDELTYSVCGLCSDPRLAGGVLESYQNLSLGLVRALHQLGMEVQAEEKPQPITYGSSHSGGIDQNPVCFEAPSSYEITVNGKKLIGSAQVRRKAGVLQHGSLPLSGDLTRIVQVLRFPNLLMREEAALRLLRRATTVEQVLGKVLSWEVVTWAFTTAFAEMLNLEFQETGLTSSESSRVETLAKEKYANWDWTGRI